MGDGRAPERYSKLRIELRIPVFGMLDVAISEPLGEIIE